MECSWKVQQGYCPYSFQAGKALLYPPLSISWTGLRTHEICRQRGKLIREKKKNPSQNVRGFFHGVVVDTVMRKWLENPYESSMSSMVEQVIVEEQLNLKNRKAGVVRWKSSQDKVEMTNFCKTLVVKLEPILEDLVLPYDYDTGHRFRVPIKVPTPDGSSAEILLTGEMDLLVRESLEDNSWAVWDLKATANNDYWRKTIAQLTFYDFSVRAMFGSNTTRAGLIQPMCDEQVLRTTISDASRADLMARIVNMAHDLWKGYTPPVDDSSTCAYCEVAHACEKYKTSSPHRVPFNSLSTAKEKYNGLGPASTSTETGHRTASEI